MRIYQGLFGAGDITAYYCRLLKENVATSNQSLIIFWPEPAAMLRDMIM
jgi:hypothetical protein